MGDRAQVRVAGSSNRQAVTALIAAGTLLMAATLAQAQGETIVAHGISTFGDLKYPADFKHFDYVNPDAPKGGEISEWAPGGFDTMNPFTIKGRGAALSTVMLESLMEGTSDEIGAAYCLVCSSIEYPEDRSWVIFTIRPEVRFSDGSELTAEDVVFSYETFLAKGLSSYRTVLAQQVEAAEVIDPLHMKFTFKPDFPKRDLIQAVGGLPIFSKADFETKKRDLEESSLEPFLGSGPYMLDSMDVGARITYKRNPEYWGRDLPNNVGRSNFDSIRIEYFADYQAAFEGFKAGAYTFRNEASSLIWATGYEFPALEKGWVVKDKPEDGTIANGQSFAFNLRREKFQDVRVREAIGLMFNFEWSNETLFYGIYHRINSYWENSELAATGLPTPEELALLEPLAADLPEGVLTDEPVMAPVSSSEQFDRGNMRKAAALLEAAGWITGDDGMRRNAKGETLVVDFLNDSQSFDRIINPFVENLRRVGVDARHTRVDNAQLVTRERSHDYDMSTVQYPMDYTPSSDLQQYFGSASKDGEFNHTGLADPAVDALIKVIEAATTREDLYVAARAMDRVLRAKRMWVPQWYKNVHTIAYYDMYERPETVAPFALGELDFWWYNAEKGAALAAAGAF